MEHRFVKFYSARLFKYFFVLTAGLAAFNCSAQNWQWAKSAACTYSVSGAGEGWGIATDASGNAYVTGSYTSPTIAFGTTTLTSNNDFAAPGLDHNFFLAKYDASGNVVWAKSGGGAGSDQSLSVSADAFDNIYITGAFISTTMTVGTATLINAGNADFFLAKYDAVTGNELWAVSAGGVENDGGASVVADVSGNVYVTGNFVSPSITFGTTILNNAGNGNVFLVKYDPSGNVLWAKSAGGGGTAVDVLGVSADPAGSGDVYITGDFSAVLSPTISFGTAVLTNAGSSGRDLFLAKYDASGNELWAISAGGTDHDLSNSVSADAFGNVYITGTFYSSAISFGTYTLTNSGGGGWDQSDFFCAKFNAATGNAIWAKSAGGAGGGVLSLDYGYSVSADAAGNAYVTGHLGKPYIVFGTYTISAVGSDRSFIVKYDPNGNVLCGSGLNGGGEDLLTIVADAFGNAYIGGDFQTNTFNVGTTTLTIVGGGAGVSENVFVAKYTCSSILTLSVSSANPLCNGQCNGAGTVTPVNGFGFYSYLWSTMPVQTKQTATGLCVGSYTVTVTDNTTGAISTATVSVIDPNPLAISVFTTSLSCNGDSAIATVIAGGGAPFYTYLWSNTQTNAIATYLLAGNYTVIISDANGCNKDTVVSITQPNLLTASVVSVSLSCNGDSTIATVIAGGGTPFYSYLWSNAQTNATATYLLAGNYTVTISDGNGCKKDTMVSITQPTSIVLTTTTTPTACTGNSGTAAVLASGGSPGYIYLWSNNKSTQIATGLGNGTYIIIITDTKGCVKTQTVSVTQQNNNLNIGTSSTNAGCTINNGTANAMVSGGNGPYSYSWSSITATGAAVTGLSAQTYTVIVTDQDGCTELKTVAVGTTPDPTATAKNSATIVYPNSITLSASGGISYNWSPATGLSCITCQNPVASPSATTAYCVSVTDANGCTDSACVTVTVELPCIDIYVPTAFSPNSDEQNEMECIYGTCIKTFSFSIYNRWGERVFYTNDPLVCWDGTYKKKNLDPDVFVYVLHADMTDRKDITQRGNISLIR